ncbi:MAG: glycosyltransferase N-terminal domain-containing protein [Candidatus Eisenbacteria bacterium]
MSAGGAAYAGLTSALEILAVPFSLRARARGGDRAARFGYGDARGATWIHAASVGEVTAAVPLLRLIAERRPAEDRLVSAGTPGGLAAWRRELERCAPGGAPVTVTAWPLDFPAAVRRAFARRAPRRLLIVETELWPNALAEALHRGVRVAFANGRLSDRAWGRTRLMAPVLRPLLARVSACATQGDIDRERWAELGVPREALAVTGNTKYDQLAVAPHARERAEARAAAGLDEAATVVAFGSLRPGEEGALAALARGLAHWSRSTARPVALVAVPRHPARAAALAAALGRAGVPVAEWHPGRPWPFPTGAPGEALGVAWVPRLGVLREVYALSDVAVVGGTFAPWGGHNAAEPAALGLPVVVGPHHAATRDVVQALVARDAGRVAADGAAAVEAIAHWQATPASRARAGEAARGAVQGLAGASARTLGFLEARGFWG